MTAPYSEIAAAIRPHVKDDPGHVADLIVDAVSTATAYRLDEDGATELFESLGVMFAALAQVGAGTARRSARR